MYRASKYQGIISGLVLLLLGLGCQPKKVGVDELLSEANPAPDAVATATPRPIPQEPVDTGLQRPACLEGKKTLDECIVKPTPNYTYTLPYGGRTVEGVSVTIVPTAAPVAYTIPAAYYTNQFVQAIVPELVSGNIKAGVVVGGVTGGLVAAGQSACGSVSDLLPSAVTCEFNPQSSTYYRYRSEYNGRKNKCTVGTGLAPSFNGPCWLTGSEFNGKYIYDVQMDFPDCAVNEQVAQACMADSGRYLYSKIYGGRNRNCLVASATSIGYNRESCWVLGRSLVSKIVTCNEDVSFLKGQNSSNCVTSFSEAEQAKTVEYHRYIYSQPYGGRDNICENDINGKCWFNLATKAASEPNLKDIYIRKGDIIFGVEGTYEPTPSYWGSGMHRTPLAVTPTPTAKYRYTYKDEQSLTVPLPASYHIENPDPTTDTEAIPNKFDYATVPGTCGLTGNVSARMANCNTKWLGSAVGNAGQGDWDLVTKAADGGVVWKDESTGLLWSGRISVASGINWCKSSGNSNSSKVEDKHREPDADLNPYCTQSTYQEQSSYAVSACFEGYSQTGYVEAIPTTTPSPRAGFSKTDSSIDQKGKAGLATSLTAANGKVNWRLPTVYDYQLANHNGLRGVINETDAYEWTATTYSEDRSSAWAFDSKTGAKRIVNKASKLQARCVGR